MFRSIGKGEEVGKQKTSEGENEPKGVFFGFSRIKPLTKIPIIVYSTPKLEDVTYEEISTLMKRNVLPPPKKNKTGY